MDVTGCSTVTLQDVLTFPTVTLIVAVPPFIPFTTPVSDTVAILVSDDFQVIASVKLSGVIVRLSLYELPFSIESVLSSLISLALTSQLTNLKLLSVAKVSAYVPGTP